MKLCPKAADAAVCASAGLPVGDAAGTPADAATALRRGKPAACRCRFRHELSPVAAWPAPAETRADTCLAMDAAWF